MRLFYADEATASVGGAPDIAAALAKSGIYTNGNEEAATIPNISTEANNDNTPLSPEATKVETALVPEKKEESTIQPIPEVAAVPPSVDWRDEIKKADKADIFKQLGFDEKMVGFYNTWMTGGDINKYLQAATVDYAKMSPEQLLKQHLFEQYPEFAPEDLEELYRAKVIDHYKLDPETYSEQEIRRGKLLMTADAKTIRSGMIERQQQFIMNAKPPEIPDYRKELEAQAQLQDEANAKILEQYKSQLNSHNATKELLTNKRLILGEGEDTFNYEVSDPQKALSVLQDPRQWAQQVFNEDGSPQIEKQLFLAAAVLDHKTLAKEIFKAGKALGTKQALETIENAKKPDATPATTPEIPLTPAQALARSGILSES